MCVGLSTLVRTSQALSRRPGQCSVGATPDRADRLVIVGDAHATADDIAYLDHLRSKYKLELFYARFDWELGDIGSME